MKRVARALVGFIMLFLAFSTGILGILLFKSLFRDFSLLEISYKMILTPFLGGAFFLALGVYFGFHAFKKMMSP